VRDELAAAALPTHEPVEELGNCIAAVRPACPCWPGDELVALQEAAHLSNLLVSSELEALVKKPGSKGTLIKNGGAKKVADAKKAWAKSHFRVARGNPASGLIKKSKGVADADNGTVAVRRVIERKASFSAIYELSPLERADVVVRGVPAQLLERLAVELVLPKEKVYTLVGASRATVERKLKSNQVLNSADSEHAMGMARLVGQVQRVVQESGNLDGFDVGRWVAAFLDAPSAALGGRRPADLMRTSEGCAVVCALVSQMQSGAYA
jgi:putative toxin-antitoxin system antitoxin component (TIGR02293 family)